MTPHDPGDLDHSDERITTLEHAQPAIRRFLAGRDEPVENLDLVVIAVRKAELDRRDVGITDLPYDAVYRQVTTTHLPALAEQGLVEYDRASGAVAPAVPPAEMETSR